MIDNLKELGYIDPNYDDFEDKKDAPTSSKFYSKQPTKTLPPKKETAANSPKKKRKRKSPFGHQRAKTVKRHTSLLSMSRLLQLSKLEET